MGRVTVSRPVTRFTVGVGATRRPDTLVAEEPLEIRLNGSPLAVTMRTPGDDVNLAHGFLLTEGVISGPGDVRAAMYCAGSVVDDDSGQPQNTYNVLDVRLADGVAPPAVDPTRNFYTTSSCGVCGKASIDAIEQQTRWSVADDAVVLDPEVMVRLPDLLRERQRAFDRTGGLHAAGLFTADGTPLRVAEDVGRHNAVDKVIGWAMAERGLPLSRTVLQVSARASFELVQKSAMAGIPMMSAVSAPSALAFDYGRTSGVTVIGFNRGGRFNVYSHPERIA